MSAHGVPGAFSSALRVLWRGILIIISIFLLSKLFVYLFPDFTQSGVKNKITNYYQEKNLIEENIKSEYAWNILRPETWTYEAMIKRQEEFENNKKNNYGSSKNRYIKPILVPTIDEWNRNNNPAYRDYTGNYYGQEKTAGTDNWITDGSIWTQTETDWNQ